MSKGFDCPKCGFFDDIDDLIKDDKVVCSNCKTAFKYTKEKCPRCDGTGVTSHDIYSFCNYYEDHEPKYEFDTCQRCYGRQYLEFLDGQEV